MASDSCSSKMQVTPDMLMKEKGRDLMATRVRGQMGQFDPSGVEKSLAGYPWPAGEEGVSLPTATQFPLLQGAHVPSGYTDRHGNVGSHVQPKRWGRDDPMSKVRCDGSCQKPPQMIGSASSSALEVQNCRIEVGESDLLSAHGSAGERIRTYAPPFGPFRLRLAHWRE